MAERVRIEHYEAEDVHNIVKEYAGGSSLRERIKALLQDLVDDARDEGGDPDPASTTEDILALMPMESPARTFIVEDLVNRIGEIYERAMARQIVQAVRSQTR